MSGISMQNSSRKLGEFHTMATQDSEEVKHFGTNVLRKTCYLCFRALEDHHTCSAIHTKFGSGLTCSEQSLRYVF